jgi:hypothetical protein
MTTRAEIEAQIAALKAVLKEKEIDPDFTPKELVRWDPSLIGTMLHMKHPISMPRWILDINRLLYQNCCSYEMEMEQFCPITLDGIIVNDDINPEFYGKLSRGVEKILTYNVKNDFRSMTTVPLWLDTKEDMAQDISIKIKSEQLLSAKISYHPKWRNMDINLPSLNDLGVKRGKRICKSTCIGYSTDSGVTPPPHCTHNTAIGTLPLCGPDDNILDHIFIASVVKLPFQEKEVVIDKYPLSKLYEEWKADKAAGRTRRSA